MIKTIFILLFTFTFCRAQPNLVELRRFGGTGNAPGNFADPSALDISDDGRLFICDVGNQRIQIYDLMGRFRINVGGFGWAVKKFDQPMDIWSRSTINIYIADYNNQRVQRFDKDMNFIGEKKSNPGGNENFQFLQVLSVAYSSQGDLFILDAGENKVIKFNNQDQGDVSFGFYDSGQGELTSPIQLELSTDHRVIVSDAEAEALFVYDYFGNYMFRIEHPDFKQPMGLALDRDNRIYVADPENKSIFEFSPSGKYLSQFRQVSGIPFTEPIDLAIHQTEKQTRFYIIDGDDIIIAERVAVTPKE